LEYVLNFISVPHAWILFITATLSLIAGISAWQRRYYLTGKILTLFMLSTAIWAFFSGIEAITIGLSNKIFWSKMEYLGFVWAAPLCFLFVFAYTNHWKWIKPPVLAVIGTISIVTLILAWTNEYHGLIWDAIYPGNSQLNLAVYHHGTWFWVYTGIQFVLYCLNVIVLLRDLRFQKPPYRQQTITILIATLLPAVTGILYSFGISPIPGLDWMPIFTFFTGLMFVWSIYYYRLLDLVPIARDALVEQMLDGMVVLDDQQRIIDINPSARKMIKKGAEIKIGDNLSSVLPDLHSSLIGTKNRSNTQVLTFQESSAELRYMDVRFAIIKGIKAGTNCTLLILRDITKRKTIEDSLNQANQELEKRIEEIQILQHQLREESIRDPLTNLYNRRYLEDSLQREFARAHRDEYPISVIMADIDHFKRVNDTYGHSVGDEVLQQLSQILLTSFRLEDIICRYGGEEFIIVMPSTTVETAFIRTENFRDTLEKTTMEISGQKVQITLSAGVAVYPLDGSSVEDVINAADRALYQAKSAGRNQVVAVRQAI
jgi:diguanylate cyclase (GGDEF)-like protein/PAS domain S-box-containing protein